MATTNVLNFYIDYENGTTQKISGEVETLTTALKAKGKLWRNRIMNEHSDLVFPYAWFFFSRPSDEHGYSMLITTDYVKDLTPEDLYHARDCRMTATSTEDTTIFGIWEV